MAAAARAARTVSSMMARANDSSAGAADNSGEKKKKRGAFALFFRCGRRLHCLRPAALSPPPLQRRKARRDSWRMGRLCSRLREVETTVTSSAIGLDKIPWSRWMCVWMPAVPRLRGSSLGDTLATRPTARRPKSLTWSGAMWSRRCSRRRSSLCRIPIGAQIEIPPHSGNHAASSRRLLPRRGRVNRGQRACQLARDEERRRINVTPSSGECLARRNEGGRRGGKIPRDGAQ